MGDDGRVFGEARCFGSCCSAVILAPICTASLALCRLPGSRAMEDLEALVAIVAGGGLGPAADDELVADPQLDMLVAIAAAVPAERRKHEQRSWQAMEKARGAKRQRKTERELATAQEGKRKSEESLKAVASLAPRVARSLGVTVAGAEMTAERAEQWALVATRPTFRGDESYSLFDRRAVFLMAGRDIRGLTGPISDRSAGCGALG